MAVSTTNPQPIIDTVDSGGIINNVKFDPDKHLAYKRPEAVITMKDLGFPKDTGVSSVAVSQPFQLFSPDAINYMRMEILRPQVMENYRHWNEIAPCQVRGYATAHASFIRDAWKHPETLAAISDVAGIELTIQMDYEIGHLNFSVNLDSDSQHGTSVIGEKECELGEANSGSDRFQSADIPVIGWHKDSYPFACVLMLSDCTNTVGGETVLQKSDGTILKIPKLDKGSAIVIQGRYITHQGLRVLGGKERITMVTSLWPSSPFVRDDTVLHSVRAISDLSEVYYQFTTYRLEMLGEVIKAQLKAIKARRQAGKKIDIASTKEFISAQELFLSHTNKQIAEEAEAIVDVVERTEIDN